VGTWEQMDEKEWWMKDPDGDYEVDLFFIYLFKESLIALSLRRLWRWTAAPKQAQVASFLPASQSHLR